MKKLLPKSFYNHHDVVSLAKKLLGKRLCTNINGKYTSGIITETEAYAGVTDRASHAYGGKLTKRTKTMFEEGGTAYVYLCYGIHHLFNIVTNKKGIPHAILIRAIQPDEGIEIMMKRRKKNKIDKTFSGGPGTVSQALGIHVRHSGKNLLDQEIWVEETGIKIPEKEIIAGPRIGVDYAGEDAKLPYRFLINSKFKI
ncbi:MAG TPA: DNA-3-methyladenine glycosylase [Bacteroidia bacterium]|nr:DNA-3-methyladenine glycosylase [Bacteroidia bacterium]